MTVPNVSAPIWWSCCVCLCLIIGCTGAQEQAGVGTDPAGNPGTMSSAEDATTAQSPTSAESETGTGESQADAPAESDSALRVDGSWWYFRGNAQAQGFVEKRTLPDTLRVVWEFEAERTAFEGSPVLYEGKVVLGDMDGTLWCLDAMTGKKQWSQETDFGFFASPTVSEDGIFIGDSNGVFHCFDWEGNPVWTYEAGAQIDSAANFYKDQVLFGSEDSVLYSLNRKDGKENWQHQTDDQIRCSIVVAQDRTYVAGCDGRLHLVQLEDGSGLGEVPLNAVTGSTPATWGDRVYFGLEDGQFVCIDVQKKEIVWDWRHATGEAAIRSSAAVDGTHVVFGNRASQVVCLNQESGEVVWQYEAERKVDGSPVIVGDRVYVGDGAAMFLVLELSSGELIQEMELSGAVLGSPCVAGNCLIVATDEGMVYCLGSQ